MVEISTPIDFARIMRCTGASEREIRENSMHSYSNNNYSGARTIYSENRKSNYNPSAERYS